MGYMGCSLNKVQGDSTMVDRLNISHILERCSVNIIILSFQIGTIVKCELSDVNPISTECIRQQKKDYSFC